MSLTATIFAACFAGAMLMTLFRNPLWGLYAYVAEFYLHPIDRWWGRDLPDLRWSLLAGGITLLAVLVRPGHPSRPGWTSSGAARILIALTVWIWIQNLWALSSSDQLTLSVLFTKYLVLFYLMNRLLDGEEALTGFLIVNTLGCLYLGWLVLTSDDSGRLESVGGPGIEEANSLGMHLGTVLLFSASLVAGKAWGPRLLALAAAPLIVNAIIQTESRGAFLGVVAGALALVYLSPRAYRKYWYFLGIAGIAVVLRAAPAAYWERVNTIFTPSEESGERDQSAETRLALIKVQWRMFLAYPLGSGHRGTAVLSPQYMETRYLSNEGDTGIEAERSSHNTFMTLLTEQGIPGAVLFLALLAWVFSACRRLRAAAMAQGPPWLGPVQAAVGGAIIVVLVSGLFTDYLKAEIQIWCIGLLAILDYLSHNQAMASAVTAGTSHRNNPALRQGAAELP